MLYGRRRGKTKKVFIFPALRISMHAKIGWIGEVGPCDNVPHDYFQFSYYCCLLATSLMMMKQLRDIHYLKQWLRATKFSALSLISLRGHVATIYMTLFFRSNPPFLVSLSCELCCLEKQVECIRNLSELRWGLSQLTSQFTWAFWLVWMLLCILTGKPKVGGKRPAFKVLS